MAAAVLYGSIKEPQRKQWVDDGHGGRRETIPSEEISRVADAVNAFVWLHEFKTLPAVGAMRDQSIGFIESVNIINGEIAVHRRETERRSKSNG
jgi:hypothetical protein